MASHSSHATFRALGLALFAWGTVAIGGPVLHWVLRIVFGDGAPVLPASVWLRFGAVMAVYGMIVGAVVFIAERSGRSWAGSFAFTLVLAAVAIPTIEDFAREPFGRFVATTLMVSLLIAMLMIPVHHALSARRR
jgi:hypothetical protein